VKAPIGWFVTDVTKVGAFDVTGLGELLLSSGSARVARVTHPANFLPKPVFVCPFRFSL
jgi:hypothetical protein